MSDIVWGRPISVDGDCPSWLSMDTRIERKNPEWPLLAHTAGNVYWPFTGEIRLPADHFAYLAIAKGFEPWAGGDSAPDDWDQGAVLLRSGDICLAKHITYWGDDGQSNDIIGYKRKQAKDDGDYVSVKRMTEEDIIDGRFAKYSTYEPLTAITEALRDIGIIREPTKAETIAQKTGLTVDQVQSVLNEVSHGTR